MWFYFGETTTILFEDWKTENAGGRSIYCHFDELFPIKLAFCFILKAGLSLCLKYLSYLLVEAPHFKKATIGGNGIPAGGLWSVAPNCPPVAMFEWMLPGCCPTVATLPTQKFQKISWQD